MVRSKQARQPEDKAARRQTILEAAERLYLLHGIEKVTIARVAREASLAKGTIYIYFPTKEAIFIELLLAHLSEWFDVFTQQLQSSPRWDAPTLSQMLAGHLDERPMLVRLLALMHIVLEKNLDVETMVSFKRRLIDSMNQVTQTLCDHVDGLTETSAGMFMLEVHAIIVGVGQMTQHSPIHDEVVAALPVIEEITVDFAPMVEQMVCACLKVHLAKP